MPETLAAFVKGRAERSLRKFLEQIEGLTPEEALRDRLANWPGQRWGIGQDGSIAGIVYHVAAWKQMTLPLLRPGGQALTQETFDYEAAPNRDDWEGIAAWCQQVGTAWNAELARLPEAAFEETRAWEGMTLALGRIIVEMVEHDIQHAAQIEYLRQHHRAGKAISPSPLGKGAGGEVNNRRG
jgi:hypothetical protein